MKTYPGLALLLCISLAHATPLEPIERLDLQRYLGTWHEIAKYPNRFQEQCVSDTTATYARMDDGRIEVINRCRTASGEFDEARGVARLVGEAGSPRLEVRFAPAWLSWLPMAWGDYWVIDLDEAYTLVAISEPSKEYLWILARDADVAGERVEALVTRLEQRGFDAARIVRSPHDSR
ncbi:lipocalin family protein [Pseudazoarcus pumilus]|uniref:Outer membrane lipoprotein Blc n=1 Tax=Pseudazoarcus pumilus TaxID=2067960 RepID=A0A2I6S741_9RHOO|nr:lipocalin family protein [Pseudazoarcus pumilus]AUN95051.1 lipocalin [Pseudazoarcus pumilus]